MLPRPETTSRPLSPRFSFFHRLSCEPSASTRHAACVPSLEFSLRFPTISFPKTFQRFSGKSGKEIDRPPRREPKIQQHRRNDIISTILINTKKFSRKDRTAYAVSFCFQLLSFLSLVIGAIFYFEEKRIYVYILGEQLPLRRTCTTATSNPRLMVSKGLRVRGLPVPRPPISRYFTPCRAARLNHRVIMLEESLSEKGRKKEGWGEEERIVESSCSVILR